MRSHYSMFLEEYADIKIIEDERGFCTYQIMGDECYMENVFVLPEYRRTKAATEYGKTIEKIAKENGCSFVSGSVCLDAKDPERSMRFMKEYGFKFWRKQNNAIYYKKEL